jgi:hypothetical protein
MKQWHFRLKSAALENSYYIQDSNLNRALEAAKYEFDQDHKALGVTAISAEVVLQEQVEI